MADASNKGGRFHTEDGVTTPVPDPTTLTTEALRREIGSLREILSAKIDGQKNEIETRLDGMDKAIALLQKTNDLQPALVDGKIKNLETLHEEKFQSIATQFAERDTRTEQLTQASKVAVDAALQAQKEAAGAQNESISAAIAKSETAFTKSIDQQGMLISTTANGLNDKIDDVKSRLTTIESQSKGIDVGRSDPVTQLLMRVTANESTSKGERSGVGISMGAVVGLIGALAAIVTIMGFVIFLATKR